MTPLSLIVADDHDLVRRGICATLLTQSGWTVSAEARDGREAVEKTKALTPDVIVMDIGMPRLNGIEATRQIIQQTPDARILILTAHNSEALVREAIHAGARGYMLKTDTASGLIKGVATVRRDQSFFTSKVAAVARAVRMQPQGERARVLADYLTPRQREVLQLLAEGKTSREIAMTVDLSIKTVETHRTHIMDKLDCHSISALVRYAVRNHVIEA